MSLYYRFGPLNGENYNLGGNASNITGCPDGVKWMWTLLADCVITTRQEVSAYFGLASLLTWILVSVPQMIKNFRNLDGLAGVSFFLLFQWAGGDITNLVGAFLTHQLRPQILVACYFVLSDVILLAQYSAYVIRKRHQKKQAAGESSPTPQLILCLMGLFAISQGMWNHLISPSSSATMDFAGNADASVAVGHLSRSLLSVSADGNSSLLFQPEKNLSYHIQRRTIDTIDGVLENSKAELHTAKTGKPIFWHDELNVVGYTIGIMSSLFYLGSRIAQIYKNIKSQSTDGLAVLTFILAVFGNVFYGAQILIQDLSTEFLLEKTPWLVGSLGVVGLDCFLLFQFNYYNRKHRNRDEINKALLTKEFSVNADEVPQSNGYGSRGSSSINVY